ncbi:hypothetical protein Patl1_29851 [Pistacia atlantica]|uniref:Uncharacterized protein n=1 Tax=Pistacia atlantica TaxID=434234 RepID=A0ACC1AEL0_9ROSI|nr:hypothetical protein Patl1_29851 [Pistacia atlantica]
MHMRPEGNLVVNNINHNANDPYYDTMTTDSNSSGQKVVFNESGLLVLIACFCRLNPGDKRPICECPKGYFLSDPNNRYSDCKPSFIQSCADDEKGSPADLYDFEEVINSDWPTSDYALLQPFTEEQCRESCLQVCVCAVAIF